MEWVGDDLLALILNKIDDPNERKPLSLVSKQWLRVEGLQRLSLHVLELDLLPNFLPRFPNLLKFHTSKPIPNPLLKLLANTCPRIQVLHLSYEGADDFDAEGLCDIAKSCPDLETLVLRRSRIRNYGVASFLGFSRNLRNLDLGFCRKVSGVALESIADLNCLEALNLQGCRLITDEGLVFLGMGRLCETLKILNLAECDRITDYGLLHFMKMDCLEELNLAECGTEVTDLGIYMGVAGLCGLKKLNLSWLVNVSDETLVALAKECQGLEVLDLTGCVSVSRTGVRAFAGYQSLKELFLTLCYYGVTGDDLEQLVFGCKTLQRIVLDERLRPSIPISVQENIMRRNCVLNWE